MRPKLVNRPPVGFSIGSTNKPASLDFSATACESPKAPPYIQSLEPSLLVLHLLGGHPSNGPFAPSLHLHRHQPCRSQHLHILSSSKASVHTTLSITHHSRKQPAVVRTHHWFSIREGGGTHGCHLSSPWLICFASSLFLGLPICFKFRGKELWRDPLLISHLKCEDEGSRLVLFL